MEGLAGQDDWQSFLFSHPEKYPAGQKLLAAGHQRRRRWTVHGGATQVDVVDAHGSGTRTPDLPARPARPRAKQVFRDKAFDPYVDLTEPNVYDAVVAVAMHAKTGSHGFAYAHDHARHGCPASTEVDHGERDRRLFRGQVACRSSSSPATTGFARI
jgi:hypothetical protein